MKPLKKILWEDIFQSAQYGIRDETNHEVWDQIFKMETLIFFQIDDKISNIIWYEIRDETN